MNFMTCKLYLNETVKKETDKMRRIGEWLVGSYFADSFILLKSQT